MFAFHRRDLARDGRSRWLMEPLNDHKRLLLSTDRGFPMKIYLGSPSCNLRCGSRSLAWRCAACYHQWRPGECFLFPIGERRNIWVFSIQNFILNRLYLIAIKDLRNATVRDAQLPWYLTRPHAGGSELDDLQSNVRWQRSPVDENTSELVDASLSRWHVA